MNYQTDGKRTLGPLPGRLESQSVGNAIDALEAKVNRQAIIIARWVQHDATCAVRGPWAQGLDVGDKCDCGLTKALHPQEQQG